MKLGLRKILVMSLLAFSFAGCNDEEGSDLPQGNENALKQPNPTGVYNKIGGVTFNKDSVVKAAIIQYNFLTIADIATDHIEALLKSNKVLLYSNNLGDCYGYSINSDIMDSLKYFNYTQNDISTKNKEKDIVLTGRNPYKDQGKYEDVIISHEGLQSRHPELYKWAVNTFLAKEKPEITDIDIPNESGTYVEYEAKVKLASGEEEYISFNVSLEKEQICVKLNSSTNK